MGFAACPEETVNNVRRTFHGVHAETVVPALCGAGGKMGGC